MDHPANIKQKFLDSLTIDNPCPKDWNEMSGDDKSRYCDVCDKYVYDISAITLDESCELLANSSGSICLQLKRTRTGKTLTKISEPSRVRNLFTIFRVAAAVVSAVCLTLSADAQNANDSTKVFWGSTRLDGTNTTTPNSIGGVYAFVERLKLNVAVAIAREVPNEIHAQVPTETPNETVTYFGGGSALVTMPVTLIPYDRIHDSSPVLGPERLFKDSD